MFRLLTTELFFHGIRKGSTVITYAGGSISVEPFEKELHSTVFVPGPVAILKSKVINEFLLDDIEMMVGRNSPNMDKKRLDEYFHSSSLYFDENTGEKPVFLKIGVPCQIIPIS